MPIQKIAFSTRFARREKENENFYVVIAKGTILSLLDILLTLAVGTFAFFMLIGYIVSPIERGFYCDDKSITKPLKPHTITPLHLILATLCVPLFTVFICEGIYFSRFRNQTLSLRKYFASSTGIYLAYLLTFSVATLMMEVGKCAFGRLRPHFLEACKPDWSLVDCKTDPTAYIADAHCTNDARAIRIGRGSFPSGHSEGAVLAFMFLYFYLTELVAVCKTSDLLPKIRAVVL
uniref:Phosphatidic acid phosphatase type 2/haloperoxidase domain-containing protein n=1 Tax=Plectus sambesii TaxID=2011161 RepID=A0A914XG35_9BILA